MNQEDWARRYWEDDPYEFQRGTAFKSTANPTRLQAIYDKAAEDGEAYRQKYGNPWDKLNRGQLADMNKTVQDAKAESRTCNPLFKTINEAVE